MAAKAGATLGEIVAWVVGWCLMLEYGVSVAAVAVGWGQYLNEFLETFGVQIPPQFAAPPGEQALLRPPAGPPLSASRTPVWPPQRQPSYRGQGL